jgi:hypothetical protein
MQTTRRTTIRRIRGTTSGIAQPTIRQAGNEVAEAELAEEGAVVLEEVVVLEVVERMVRETEVANECSLEVF